MTRHNTFCFQDYILLPARVENDWGKKTQNLWTSTPKPWPFHISCFIHFRLQKSIESKSWYKPSLLVPVSDAIFSDLIYPRASTTGHFWSSQVLSLAFYYLTAGCSPINTIYIQIKPFNQCSVPIHQQYIKISYNTATNTIFVCSPLLLISFTVCSYYIYTITKYFSLQRISVYYESLQNTQAHSKAHSP